MVSEALASSRETHEEVACSTLRLMNLKAVRRVADMGHQEAKAAAAIIEEFRAMFSLLESIVMAVADRYTSRKSVEAVSEAASPAVGNASGASARHMGQQQCLWHMTCEHH